MGSRSVLASAVAIVVLVVVWVGVTRQAISTLPDCRARETPVRVELPSGRYPQVLAIIRRAKANGAPIVLHKLTAGAARRRRAAEVFAGLSGLGLFQYPPAIGRPSTMMSAHVARVPRRERSATRRISRRLRGWCSGQTFVVVGV